MLRGLKILVILSEVPRIHIEIDEAIWILGNFQVHVRKTSIYLNLYSKFDMRVDSINVGEDCINFLFMNDRNDMINVYLS